MQILDMTDTLPGRYSQKQPLSVTDKILSEADTVSVRIYSQRKKVSYIRTFVAGHLTLTWLSSVWYTKS